MSKIKQLWNAPPTYRGAVIVSAVVAAVSIGIGYFGLRGLGFTSESGSMVDLGRVWPLSFGIGGAIGSLCLVACCAQVFTFRSKAKVGR